MSTTTASPSAAAAAAAPKALRFIDIGINLTDGMFKGEYNGKKAHESDFDQVLSRARKAGVEGQIITGGSLSESRAALAMAKEADDLYCTVGCHPTRSSEFVRHKAGASAYLEALSDLIKANGPDANGKSKVVAIGELGLDYDRLHFSSGEEQREHFELQLELQRRFDLPLFLHSRAAHGDFVKILKPHLEALRAQGRKKLGVVHSFTDSAETMREYIALGLYIGVNGCSLKTQENLDVVKQIPLEWLMLETDGPWCDPRPTHASAAHLNAWKAKNPELSVLYHPPQLKKEKFVMGSAVKGRCEPCSIGGIAAIVAGVKGISVEEVAEAAERNTRLLFGL